MKSILVILFISISYLTFGQSDYTILENKYDKNRINVSKIEKFDSIKNITTVKVYSTSINLNGKWLDFDHQKFLNENIVSHAAIVINQNDLILEYGIYSLDSFQNYYFTKDLQKFNKKFLKFNLNEKSEILNTFEGEYKNYYIHKIKRYGRHNKNNFFTTYTLIGKKNNHFYWFTLYNVDLTNFENSKKFLVDTFNNN
jgi:hypothetical protein